MHFQKLGVIFLIVILLTQIAICQYKAIDFSINVSSIGDDYTDSEYKYDSASGVILSQAEVGYTFSTNSKFTLSPKVAFAYAFSRYYKRQLVLTGGSLSDRTFIEKSKKSAYLKTGIALSYWVSRPGNGLFLEAELQNLTCLSAKSKEMKRVGSADREVYTIDYSEDVRSNVPSLRISAGYRLVIKNVSLFVKLSRDLRVSTYFNTTDNYTFINRSLGFGCSYIFQHSNNVDTKGEEES